MPRSGSNEQVPRRCDLERLAPAENAIFAAIREVEQMPADERLTAAVLLLKDAFTKVSDYIDEVLGSE